MLLPHISCFPASCCLLHIEGAPFIAFYGAAPDTQSEVAYTTEQQYVHLRPWFYNSASTSGQYEHSTTEQPKYQWTVWAPPLPSSQRTSGQFELFHYRAAREPVDSMSPSTTEQPEYQWTVWAIPLPSSQRTSGQCTPLEQPEYQWTVWAIPLPSSQRTSGQYSCTTLKQ